MADAIVWNLASKALELLARSSVREAASWWGARDDLKKLESSIRLIQARVRDAERRQEDATSEAIKEWLRRLKLVLYQADDFFDKVVSLDLLNEQRMEKSMLCKVGILFSKFGPLCYNIKLANEIKSIRKQLDDIKSDMAGLNLSALPAQQLPMTRLLKHRETSSVLKKEVIGREDDKTNIIKMLLDDSKQFTVISVVGYGGLGKTTLAQLVFNDDEVKQHFDLTTWAHVPEKDDLKIIKGKILQAFKNEDCQNQLLDYIERGIINSIETKKYLLVLDDLWYEGADIDELVNLLKRGKHGSKVIVTTRLDAVAKRAGSIEAPYRLGTLTDDESRELFRNSAFGWESINAELMRTIGEDIVKMCGNVPLAIEVVGGSLKSKHTDRWLQVKDELSKAKLAGNDEIMAILKLSYDYLPLESRLCFAYCSLFPKGYEFKKDDLVSLWMAQGYVQPDNGDEHFWDLVARNIFQCIILDYFPNNNRRYKMHDLLYDLAQAVAGDEMLGYERPRQIHDPNRLIHVYINGSTCPSSMKNAKRLRSLLQFTCNTDDENLFSEFQSLRVLSIYNDVNQKLPNSIGRLIHLRYLNLRIKVQRLPESITSLVNLQTLDLESCFYLKELPIEFARLVKLRHLLLPETLTDLPPGFGKLTCLQELNMFIVGKGNGLDSLGTWNHGGHLWIKFRRWRGDAIEEVKRAYLKDNHQLTSLSLVLGLEEEEATPTDGEMNEMLKCLQLPSNLKNLNIWEYKGSELPGGWLDGLSKLVSINIIWCKMCKALPHLNWLPHLESLTLHGLDELEYIEDEDNTATHNRCFQSLEELKLFRCYKLKGWMRVSKDDGELSHSVFPCLLKLSLSECPMLMCMPLAPKLESLYVNNINWKMVESNLSINHEVEAASSSSAPPSASTLFTSLKKLYIRGVDDGLITLSISSGSLCNLSTITISNCSYLRKLRFESSNSIQNLSIKECSRLKNISEGLQHLSVLENLDIEQMENLAKLPEEIGNLPMLRRLHIRWCSKVKSLPKSIQKLTSLQTLIILDCPDITKKSMPDGEDWHLIQHIPNIEIMDDSNWYIKRDGKVVQHYTSSDGRQ